MKYGIIRILSLCLLLAGTAFSQINSSHYQYVSIDVPGAFMTVARGVNNNGVIVGYYSKSHNPACGLSVNCDLQGFILKNKQFTTIKFPGALQTEIHGVNDFNDVVGTFWDGHNSLHGFLLRHTGQFVRLDQPNRQFTVANGITNGGTVVGTADNIGFIWKSGTFTTFNITVPGRGESEDLLGISNTGILAGTLFRQDFFNGFQKAGSDLDVFARINGTDTHIMAVNSRDDLVGAAPGTDRAFVVFHSESGETTETNEPLRNPVRIRFPGSTGTTAWSINFAQSIVGSFTTSDSRTHGFLAVH